MERDEDQWVGHILPSFQQLACAIDRTQWFRWVVSLEVRCGPNVTALGHLSCGCWQERMEGFCLMVWLFQPRLKPLEGEEGLLHVLIPPDTLDYLWWSCHAWSPLVRGWLWEWGKAIRDLTGHRAVGGDGLAARRPQHKHLSYRLTFWREKWVPGCC